MVVGAEEVGDEMELSIIDSKKVKVLFHKRSHSRISYKTWTKLHDPWCSNQKQSPLSKQVLVTFATCGRKWKFTNNYLESTAGSLLVR